MRPAGRGPLESLYFDYPYFPPKPVAELASGRGEATVAIVGAGPIGMTAALTLAANGVDCVLLDRKETFNDGSRATCIARSSMQIFEQIGAVAPFLAKSLGWRHGTSYYRGQPVFRLEMAHGAGEKYLPMYNLQQQYMEKFLHDAVAACPLIDMRWQSEVNGCDQSDANGCRLAITTPLGNYALDAGFVLAADGARSPMRGLLGLRLAGQNFEGRYVIADVRMQHDYPTERRAFFEPRSIPGGTLLIHKQPDDIWRIDYQLEEGRSAEEATREDNIRARVAAVVDEIGHKGSWELEWWSIYSANTLCLDDYKHGRVIFIGDSAHIVPIFGVRGLNNGVADAHNAGWKLAYVINGEADPALLDSYTPERRGATLDVFANASKSTRFMTPPSRGHQLMREAVLSLAVHHPFARRFADPRQMQPYTYSESPLTLFAVREAEFAAGPGRGAACANARLADGSYLLERAGAGFTGLLFTDAGAANTRDLASRLATLDKRFKLITIGTCELPGGDHIADHGGAIAHQFDAVSGTFYLLRPDLHIAGRWRMVDDGEILQTMHTCLGRRHA